MSLHKKIKSLSCLEDLVPEISKKRKINGELVMVSTWNMHACDNYIVEIGVAVFDKYPVSKNIWAKPKNDEFLNFSKSWRENDTFQKNSLNTLSVTNHILKFCKTTAFDIFHEVQQEHP